jgi:hypothetical protein
VAAVPPLLFVVAVNRHRGFARQPYVVKAGAPERFAEEVEAAGGAGSVRTGVWLDLGFIASLTVPSGVVLAHSEQPAVVGVAVLAAALDLAEDALLLRALRDPVSSTLRQLRTTAACKYAGYGALFLAVLWGVVWG